MGKLGFGVTSTVWLARDLEYVTPCVSMSPLLTFCGRERHVVLKLFVTSSSSLGKHLDDEINVYERMKRASTRHPGAAAVRSHLDTFNVGRPAGDHRCLVHHPLGESTIALLHRNPVARLPIPVIAFTLRRSFLALDFLHSECQIIHTGEYCP